MKSLFIATAVIEAAAGLTFMLVPAMAVSLLLGGKLDSPAVLVLGRLCSATLLSLGFACWLARDDGPSRAALGLVAAMTLYNSAAVALLVYAGTTLGLSAIGLWPAVVLHVGMAAWCIACLRRQQKTAAE